MRLFIIHHQFRQRKAKQNQHKKQHQAIIVHHSKRLHFIQLAQNAFSPQSSAEKDSSPPNG